MNGNVQKIHLNPSCPASILSRPACLYFNTKLHVMFFDPKDLDPKAWNFLIIKKEKCTKHYKRIGAKLGNTFNSKWVTPNIGLEMNITMCTHILLYSIISDRVN